MSIELFASGNLAIDPIEKIERGIPVMSFTVACNIAADGGQDTLWIDASVVGPKMARAMQLKKGDGVWVRGPVSLRTYVQGNQERKSWQMAVNELITDRETYTA